MRRRRYSFRGAAASARKALDREAPSSTGRQTGVLMDGQDSHWSLFVRFLKFGLLAWGGPAAQIAMISKECVD